MKKIIAFLFVIIAINGCRKKDDSLVNTAPIADAGRIQNILTGTEVILDGSASNDADSDSLIFNWTFKESPENSKSKLSDVSLSHPTFIADLDGEYIIMLTVNDGHDDSEPSEVVINATPAGSNAIPVAHAGNDRSIHKGTTVALDGTASSDANGHNLTYTWRIKSSPNGSSCTVSDETSSTTSITPDIDGTYIIELVVHDGEINSTPDEVVITVTTAQNKKAELMALGLDEADAQYLLNNHANDVDAVLSNQNRIFKDMPALDNNMFALASDPDSAPFADPQIVNWSESYKTGFKKMYGRLVFVINTPLFINAFNNHINLLNPAYQGTGNNDIPFPRNYNEFRDAANKALLDFNYRYKFFVSQRKSGLAWGMYGLKLKVEDNMFGPQNPGAPHNPASLVLHEITHTWGYQHSSSNSDDVTLKPNNVPYYVQFLVGVSYKNPEETMVYGTPDALLTVYFGNN